MRAARPFQLSRILFRSANEPYWRRFTERRQSSNHDHYQDHENEVFGYGESPKIKFRLGKGTVKNIHSSKSPLRRAFFYGIILYYISFLKVIGRVKENTYIYTRSHLDKENHSNVGFLFNFKCRHLVHVLLRKH